MANSKSLRSTLSLRVRPMWLRCLLHFKLLAGALVATSKSKRRAHVLAAN
jgi:hypothetical protein